MMQIAELKATCRQPYLKKHKKYLVYTKIIPKQILKFKNKILIFKSESEVFKKSYSF